MAGWLPTLDSAGTFWNHSAPYPPLAPDFTSFVNLHALQDHEVPLDWVPDLRLLWLVVTWDGGGRGVKLGNIPTPDLCPHLDGYSLGIHSPRRQS